MTITQSKRRPVFFVFLYVLFVLLCFYPYEFYSMYFLFLPDKTYITTFIFLVLTVFATFLFRVRNKPKTILINVLTIQFLGYFLSGIIHGSVLGSLDNLMTMTLAVALIVLIEGTIGLEEFYKRYNKWILLMAVLGTIAFFLITLFGLKPFAVMLDRAGGVNGKSLYNYILTFTKSDESIIGLIRYAGYFDEPGAMGYWGIYALVINQLFIKDKRLGSFLIVCLIFTLSLGYFIQVVLFLILFHFRRNNIGRNLLLFLCIGAVFWGISQTQGTANEELYNRTFGRVINIQENMSYNSSIAVDDRADLTENALREFRNNPLFGTDNHNVEVGNNVYESLALYGIVGTAFILFPFILLLIWSVRFKDSDLLKASIVIIAGFMHRPFHPSLLYFFILYCIIIMSYKRHKGFKIIATV